MKLLTLGVAVAFASGTAKPLHAQAPGVAIIEQSPEGLDRDDAELAAQVVALDKAGSLPTQQTLLAQMENPSGSPLALPEPKTEKLSPPQIATLARASTVRAGWTYLCGHCGDWHFELAGGYAVSADGGIATCAHVLEPPSMERGSLIVVDAKGKVHPVTSVVAYDPAMDAAIVKIAAPTTPLALNDLIHPGDSAFCYSDPLDQRSYFSFGMVNRFTWEKLDRGEDDASIQALRHLRLNVSTPWAPGSSGAPVLDHQGNAIGHVSEIATLGDSYEIGDSSRKGDSPATISDLEGSIPFITIHTAIPARSIRALARAIKNIPNTDSNNQ